jgi:hypothetical protein
MDDVHTQFEVGVHEFGGKSPFETGDDTVFKPIELGRPFVGSEDELFVELVQVIEDVKESILGFPFADEDVDVIKNEDIDVLVEAEEVIGGIVQDGVGVLPVEEVSGDVEDTSIGGYGKDMVTDGMAEVRFTDTGGPVEEEWVEGGFTRIMDNINGGSPSEAIAFTFEEIVKSILGNELIGKLRMRDCFCLLSGGRRGFCSGVADEVGEGSIITDDAVHGIAKHVYMIVFQVLIEIAGGYLEDELITFARGRDDGGEPCIEGAFVDLSLDVRKAFIPHKFVIGLHKTELESFYPEDKGGFKKAVKKVGNCLEVCCVLGHKELEKRL